ncbi:hypothetical protein H4Q26_005795 [Puccinia striiformis f. sp. tritici PST-130]|nr:hypothetical protein H4Q26_005795 [Puccinia striiformis f. sp. tritici PST-130]
MDHLLNKSENLPIVQLLDKLITYFRNQTWRTYQRKFEFQMIYYILEFLEDNYKPVMEAILRQKGGLTLYQKQLKFLRSYLKFYRNRLQYPSHIYEKPDMTFLELTRSDDVALTNWIKLYVPLVMDSEEPCGRCVERGLRCQRSTTTRLACDACFTFHRKCRPANDPGPPALPKKRKAPSPNEPTCPEPSPGQNCVSSGTPSSSVESLPRPAKFGRFFIPWRSMPERTDFTPSEAGRQMWATQYRIWEKAGMPRGRTVDTIRNLPPGTSASPAASADQASRSTAEPTPTQRLVCIGPAPPPPERSVPIAKALPSPVQPTLNSLCASHDKPHAPNLIRKLPPGPSTPVARQVSSGIARPILTPRYNYKRPAPAPLKPPVLIPQARPSAVHPTSKPLGAPQGKPHALPSAQNLPPATLVSPAPSDERAGSQTGVATKAQSSPALTTKAQPSPIPITKAQSSPVPIIKDVSSSVLIHEAQTTAVLLTKAQPSSGQPISKPPRASHDKLHAPSSGRSPPPATPLSPALVAERANVQTAQPTSHQRPICIETTLAPRAPSGIITKAQAPPGPIGKAQSSPAPINKARSPPAPIIKAHPSPPPITKGSEPSTSIAKGSEPPTPITNGSQPPTPMIESLPSPILITEALSSLAPITEIRPFPVPPTVQSLPVSQDKPRVPPDLPGSSQLSELPAEFPRPLPLVSPQSKSPTPMAAATKPTAVSSSIPLNSTPDDAPSKLYPQDSVTQPPTCFDLTVPSRSSSRTAVPFTTGIAAAVARA